MVDAILVVVTLVAIGIAVAMGIITWRVLDLERRRPEGLPKVAEAAASDPAGAADLSREPGPGSSPEWEGDLAPSWPGRRREPNLVEWSGPGESGHADPVPVWPDRARAQARERRWDATPRPDRREAGSDSADSAERSADGGRRLLLAVVLGAAAVVTIGGSVVAIAERSARQPDAASAAADSPPLELLALVPEREGGRIAIRGVVRNPRQNAGIRDLSAVVFLFGRDGAYLGASRAAIVETLLAPGEESPFEILLPSNSPVDRYRVSFRSGTTVLAHVDRRARAAGSPPSAVAPAPSPLPVRHAWLGGAPR